MNMPIAYLVYIVISLGLTIWVARTLHRNGRVFLVESFHGNAEMADSVNHLLVLGGMHFFNMWNISKMRSKALRHGRTVQQLA